MMFTIGIICGGPTQERGISLNSARTLIDHIQLEQTQIRTFFVDENLHFYCINSSSLYSNTPSDFDFKIDSIAQKIPQDDLAVTLGQCDLIFPVIHGPFGEDGGLQSLLESFQIPFVGSSSQACNQAYPKNSAQQQLQANHFPSLPFLAVDADTDEASLTHFWETHCQTHGAILKPDRSGSSYGVSKISQLKDLIQQKSLLLATYPALQLQPYCTLQELTLIVTTNQQQEPIALVPTETVLQNSHAAIYDYRAKYLPTNACRLHTPAHISASALQACRDRAEDIFKTFGLSDFVRMDGWLCPDRGFICTDINIISGFEENSFLFKQAATCGFSHSDIIYTILSSACARYQITLPAQTTHSHTDKQPVYIICGGASSERQVSLMSGRNTWFKLKSSQDYTPIPFFLDTEHQVWQLPYALFLHHTVEEVMDDIQQYHDNKTIIQSLTQSILSRHGLSPQVQPTIGHLSIQQWLAQAKSAHAFVLLALHGGIGEDGRLQAMLEAEGIPFNGSRSATSQLCMDKHKTIEKIRSMQHAAIDIQRQLTLSLDDLHQLAQAHNAASSYWQAHQLGTQSMIIKPLSDGCSSGIVRINNAADLARYATIISDKQTTVAANTFSHQPSPIELPVHCHMFLLEAYIQTDTLFVKHAQIHHQAEFGWFELTIVVREHQGHYSALNPSITISEHAVLSVEEKFQGGTGINLTPPPPQLISPAQVSHIQQLVCHIAQTVGIQQYARMDLFFNAQTNRLQLIEINTLPALTPSTVLFQQALAEDPAITPKQFIASLVAERIPAVTTAD